MRYVNGKNFDGLARYLAGLDRQHGSRRRRTNGHRRGHAAHLRAAACRISPIPLIDMLAEVAKAIHARGLRRVALLGTRFTVETSMFGGLGDIDTVMPQPGEIDRIHAIYMDVVAGRGTAAHADELRQLAQTFIERDGAQAVLLAGTDLTTIIGESDAGFPTIDCARVHIDAIVQRLLD